jgi:hypothetical protein
MARQTTANTVRTKVLPSRDRFWRVEDFDADPHAVAQALARLADTGDLERVRRGVYWRGHSTKFGSSLPPAVEALKQVVSDHEAVGGAGWYATNLLGLSTQFAPKPVVAVTRRAPTGLRGLRVIDRSSRIARRDARLNVTEVTLLEALEGWDKYVELKPQPALDRFASLLKRDDVRIDRVVRASATESPVVRERLRAVLEHAGFEDEAAKVARARSASARARALKVLPQPPQR